MIDGIPISYFFQKEGKSKIIVYHNIITAYLYYQLCIISLLRRYKSVYDHWSIE